MLIWRKSTYCANGHDCVEAAQVTTDTVAVRDSKRGSASPMLRFSTSQWSQFTQGIKAGQRASIQ